MTESRKNHTNAFSLRVYQGNEVIAERIFSADSFNPVVRYSVDIRNIIPSIIQRLQRTLSRKNYNFKDGDYNYLGHYQEGLDFFTKFKDNKLSYPKVIRDKNNRTKGVVAKFGLYINNKPIVEREFYVDKYNPKARFSTNLNSLVKDICDEIHSQIKSKDVNHMWDDYNLINVYGLHINNIRDLKKDKRYELLNKINDRSFISRIRSQYRS